jgi:hypothetical protein
LKNHPGIVYYIIAVFVLSVLFKAIGLIDFSITEYSGYVLVFYGIIIVYNNFGRFARIALFSGTTIFLIGILLLTVSYFEFTNFRILILPSFLFICSAGFFVLFIEDLKYLLSIILSGLFLVAGLALVFKSGRLDWAIFKLSLWRVFAGYWAVFIVVAIIVFLFSRRKN